MNVGDLAKKPRTIVLVSMRDGQHKPFLDDGAAITADGIFPNAKRQHLLRQSEKSFADGSPVYVAEVKTPPMYDGDPVARIPVLDAALKAKLEENLKAKGARSASSRRRALTEAEALAKTAAAAKKPASKESTPAKAPMLDG